MTKRQPNLMVAAWLHLTITITRDQSLMSERNPFKKIDRWRLASIAKLVALFQSFFKGSEEFYTNVPLVKSCRGTFYSVRPVPSYTPQGCRQRRTLLSLRPGSSSPWQAWWQLPGTGQETRPSCRKNKISKNS